MDYSTKPAWHAANGTPSDGRQQSQLCAGAGSPGASPHATGRPAVPVRPMLAAACGSMDGGSGSSTPRRGVSLVAAPLPTPQSIQPGVSSQSGQRTPVDTDQRPWIGCASH
jgi:hypothetical protein